MALSNRSWEAYNYAKEQRFMQRTAELAAVPRICEDCGGKGVDPGSLYEPQPCPSCAGSGKLLAPDRAERKQPGTATTALPDSGTARRQDVTKL